MNLHPYITNQYSNLTLLAQRFRQEYANSQPFPHIIIDNFFRKDILDAVLESFPDLSKDETSYKFNNKAEIKFASKRGDQQQSEPISTFCAISTPVSFLTSCSNLHPSRRR